MDLAKAEWGMKRTCQSCGARFYDMQRDPIVCPKCATVYDPEAVLKSRRGRAPAAEKVEPVAAPDVDVEVAEEEVGEDELAADADAEEEDEDIIEDASELVEDEEEVTKVIDPSDEEER